MPLFSATFINTFMSSTVTNDSKGFPNAGLSRRLGAMLYDGLLLLGVILSTAIIIPAIMTFSGAQPEVGDGQVVHEIEPFISPVFFQLYFIVVVTGFYCWFWLKNGQTLGMQSWRLKLVSDQGGPLTAKHCLLRLLSGGLSFACAGLGYWWVLIDRDHKSWHDRLSKTKVIVLPKKS
jgi:uncharacterized RDD family membrane protein YckC